MLLVTMSKLKVMTYGAIVDFQLKSPQLAPHSARDEVGKERNDQRSPDEEKTVCPRFSAY